MWEYCTPPLRVENPLQWATMISKCFKCIYIKKIKKKIIQFKNVLQYLKF